MGVSVSHAPPAEGAWGTHNLLLGGYCGRPIENSCQGVLDVVFGEDRCRARQGNAALNLGWLRRMALALLRRDGSEGSTPTKRLRAALSDDFRRHLLDLLSEEYA